MGMTENQKMLIHAVSENNLKRAREIALACCSEDNTQKNKSFVEKYKNKLTSAPNQIDVPLNIRGKLIVEDVSETFLPKRYFVSEREQELYEQIKRMKMVSDMLMEMQIPYKNATMLHGRSGTGKTTFGRYVAYKLGLPFCYLNFSNIVDSLLGKTSYNLSTIFNFVQSFSCVFMLDEVDCIAIRRGVADSSSAGEEISRTTITLMQEFDKLPNDTIVLGATNRLDKLDEAFLRRFPQKHEVKPFTRDELMQMTHMFLEDIGMEGIFSKEKLRGMMFGKVQGEVMYRLIQEIGAELYKTVGKETIC